MIKWGGLFKDHGHFSMDHRKINLPVELRFNIQRITRGGHKDIQNLRNPPTNL